MLNVRIAVIKWSLCGSLTTREVKTRKHDIFKLVWYENDILEKGVHYTLNLLQT